MAGRPTKAGLDYFELDCHMEEKVRLIQAEFGLKGFAVLVKLYQKIYGGFGYYCEWTTDSLLLFMSENGLPSDNKNLIADIVAACIRRNIFSEQLFYDFNILTSEGVQKRYLNATSKREKIELKKEYLLIAVPENNKKVVINSIFDGRNPINGGKNTQSKGKESREEERKLEETKLDNTPPISSLQGTKDEPKTKRGQKTKEPKENSIQILDRLILNYSMSDFLLEKVREWIEYKVARKEDYVEQGMKSLLTKISKEAQKNGDAAVVDIIDLSMGNSYKGILWDKISKNNNQQSFSRNGERDLLNEWRSS